MLSRSKCVTVLAISSVYANIVIAEARLEEVVVTAQKREQNLQDVPMAITALGRQLLEDNEINNVEDLTKLVPSMRFTPGDDPSNSSIRIRGVGTSVFSVAVEPNVSVVVDEVPLARTELANFEFADLERVEVLRGPQGTLFGKNSTAGLVHVITRDPSPEFEAFTRVSYESPQNFPGHLAKVQMGVSGPLTSTLGARLTAFGKQVGGHLADVAQGGDNLPDSDIWGVRGKLRWDPSDTFSARLSLEYQNVDAQSTPFVFRSANPEKAARSPEITYGEENRTTKTVGTNQADSTNQAVSLTMNWDLDGITLTSVSGWRDYDIVRDVSFPDLDGERVDVTRNGGERAMETLTQELRITSNNDSALEYTIGALLFENRLTNVFERRVEDIPLNNVTGAAVPGFPQLPPQAALLPGESFGQYKIGEASADTTNLGVFAQTTWHIRDDLNLTAGGRYIYEKLTASANSNGYTENESTGGRFSETDERIPKTSLADEAVIGTLSLSHDWSESRALYVTLSTGYRGGAFDVAATDLESAFSDPAEPETVQSIEFGSKSRFFDNRLEVNVAIFQSNFKDFQTQIVEVAGDLVPSANSRTDNAGELETRGVEIDFQAQPIESLFVLGSLLYNDAEFKEFTTKCFVGQEVGEKGGEDTTGDGKCDSQDVAGGSLPNAPKMSATLSLRYEKSFDELSSRGYAQLGGRWFDDTQYSAEQHPLMIQEAYSVWDLRLGWIGMDDRLEISAYIKNLFRQSYVAGFFPLSIVNDRRDVTHYIPADADRTFGLSVGYNW